jgi:hypothetical protein
MIRCVGEALEYGREEAPSDVRDVLDWLVSEGFVLAGERGGRDAPFGDLILDFERSPVAVRITRDRSQWVIELASGRGELVHLEVLLTAWEGGTPAPRDYPIGDRLPEVLPEGVEWRVVVPGIVSWLGSGNRTREIDEASAAWKAVMMRRFGLT